MAKYNVSKKEAAEQGIARVKLEKRSGESDKEARKRVNTSLATSKASKPAPTSPSGVGSLDDAKSFINANQASDSAGVDPNTPAIRSSVERYKGIANELGLGGKLEGLNGEMPDAPKFEETYTGLRGEQGVEALEKKLTDLTSQEELINLQFKTNRAGEEGKPVAMGVIGGRLSEHAEAARRDLEFLAIQKNAVNNELNTKYAVIDKIIQLKGMDYEVAKGQYDTQFSQAIQTFNLVKGVDDTMKSDAERAADNARANLQIVYNNIANNPDGYKSLDKGTQNMVAKLELQAGLPVGTFTSIASKNPGGEIVTTKSWQDASGKEYVSVVTKDPKTGALKTSNMLVGQGKVSGGGGGGTNADERQQMQVQSVETLFERLRGKDGYVNPTVWNDALRVWTGSTADFTAKFKNYANPRDKYNGV